MNLFDLTAVIKLDSSEAEQGIIDTESKFSKFGSNIGGALKTAGGVAVGAVAAAATAVGVLAKKSVDAYGEFEQLEGGVNKLFGEKAAKKIMQYADSAYETAGVSANAYMQQVTSFSASLIGSLGGDTEKAAEVANKAMVAMSDNANTFGTDMGSIQNAFQGFAKQNYTINNLMSAA